MTLDPAPLLAQFPGWSAAEIAGALGVTRRTVVRWRTGSRVNTNDADRLAVAAGTTPYNLWPHLLEDATRECDNPWCTTRFVPTRNGHRFCTARCKNAHPDSRAHRSAKANAARKRRRAEDPEWVERQRQYARDYRAAAVRRQAA